MRVKRITIMDTPVDPLTMQETVALIDSAIKAKKKMQQSDVNASKIIMMKKDPALREAVVNCDLISADGQSVVWASRLLGHPLPERVTGVDLMQNLVKLAHERKYRVFFFGAKEEVVKKVVEVYSEQYSPGIIAGYRNGYYKQSEEPDIARSIGAAKPDMLFVGMPSPTKEIFLHKYSKILNATYTMGVGGSFDVVSGTIPRAPLWMQRMGLEWAFRLIQEPGKLWKRYLQTNSLFIYYLLQELVKTRIAPKQ